MRLIACAIALVALAGCGDSLEDAKNDTTQAERPADTTPANDPEPVDDEGLYISLLDSVGVATPDDDVAVELGEAICDGWDNGVSFDLTVFNMTAGGLSATEAGSIMGAAAYFLCPEHLSAASAWSGA